MYLHEPVPVEKEYVFIEAIMDPTDFAGFKISELRKGDITWVDADYVTTTGELIESIHPENNRYSTNFKSACFKIIKSKEKMSFKVGDTVVIRDDSQHYHDQAENGKGEIRKFKVTEISGDQFRCKVEGEDYRNSYRKEDLKLFKKGRKKKMVRVVESMEEMETVLAKVYDNKDLRSSIVPLFIGDPGLGKTKIIERFAKKRGAKLVELITSQMSPFEISGIAMPDKDTKKMTYYNFDKIESLKSGDILFFDELLNGNPIVLNACLTILEQRRLISGKKLPNIMIIAAANPQGMVPLTPQIKERFLWYNVKFSPMMWKDFMKNKYKMPEEVSNKLCELITEEEFANNNFYTPRSIDKAVAMIAKECPTPYEDVLTPILSTMISNTYPKKRIRINKTEFLNPGESMMWLDFLKKSRV